MYGYLVMALGLWIFISPWVLGFSDITTMLWSNIIVGTLLVIIALWNIIGSKPHHE